MLTRSTVKYLSINLSSKYLIIFEVSSLQHVKQSIHNKPISFSSVYECDVKLTRIKK